MMNGGSPMVELSGAAEAALAWVQRKMNEEAALLKLAEEYPAIKDLMNQQKEIQHKIDMVVALVKEEVKI
jgi:myo-inositol catabolism protein IolC